MPIAFVACTKLINGSGASASGSIGTPGSGNGLICAASCFNRTGNLTCSDASNTWTTNLQSTNASGSNAGIASAPGAANVASTVTVTWTGALAVNGFVHEFSGTATSSMLDTAGTLTNATTGTPSTASLTNSNANCVFMASAGNDANTDLQNWATTGSGWSMNTNGFNNLGATDYGGASGYKIVTAVAAQTETWTTASGNVETAICCYQMAGGAPPQDTPELRLRSELQMRQLLAQ